MNENIDLTKILKNCPKGTKFYSTIYGEVEFDKIKKESEYPIVIITKHGNNSDIKSDGRYYGEYDDGECTLFPSKDQRDWSKFSAPWYKNEKFDPKTLQPFDKVLVRDLNGHIWVCDLFSYIKECTQFPYKCMASYYKCCIPYNDETKHLLGTTDEAPKYYRYWEE